MSKKVKKTFKKAKSNTPQQKKPVKKTNPQPKPSTIQAEESHTVSIIQETPLQTEDTNIVVEEMHEAELPQTQVSDPGSFTKEALENKKSFFKKRIFFFGMLGVVVIALGTTTFYFYSQYRKTAALLKTTSNQALSTQVVSKVGALMILPSEKPTVATVSDVTKLTGQPFFAGAQNGDEILIYQNSGKAILYRPSINKIINVAPISLGNTQTAQAQPEVAGASTSASPSATPTVAAMRVEIYNGTKTNGLTRTVEKTLLAKLPQAEVVGRGNARGDFQKTIVVDVTGSRSADAHAIANALNATVAPLPASETKPNADFLIIAGTDFVQK